MLEVDEINIFKTNTEFYHADSELHCNVSERHFIVLKILHHSSLYHLRNEGNEIFGDNDIDYGAFYVENSESTEENTSV